MNLCVSCGEDFASVKAFDAHRVGKGAFTYSEGLRMDPMREDGRRCLAQNELCDAGMAQDARGRWYLVEHRAQAWKAFHGAGRTSGEVSA